jgi:hypothetical protein
MIGFDGRGELAKNCALQVSGLKGNQPVTRYLPKCPRPACVYKVLHIFFVKIDAVIMMSGQ